MRGLVAALAVTACSSHAPPCDIQGLYTVVATSQTGNCPPESTAGVADTFTVSDGQATLIFQGNIGQGCTGPIDGCTWTCSGLLAEQGVTGDGTLQYSYAFTDTGLSGILAVTLPPQTGLPTGCNSIVQVSGTKQN